MAREVNPGTKTALTANTDLKMQFDFENPDEPENVVIGDMKSRTFVKYDDGTNGTLPRVNVHDVLTAGGHSVPDFLAALAALRDAGFDAANIPDV
jgi:hypothetical protein